MDVSGGFWSPLGVCAVRHRQRDRRGACCGSLHDALALVLGLLALFLSALILAITDSISDSLTIDDFWWTTVWAAIILAIVTAFIEALVFVFLLRRTERTAAWRTASILASCSHPEPGRRPPADDAEPARAVQLVAGERDGMVVVREEVDRDEAGVRADAGAALGATGSIGTLTPSLVNSVAVASIRCLVVSQRTPTRSVASTR